MSKDPYKKVISDNLTMDSLGALFKDPTIPVSKSEMDGALAWIDQHLNVPMFVAADVCRVLYDEFVAAGSSHDAAIMQVAGRLAGSKIIGACKGFFALNHIGMLLRMANMFPMEYRSSRVRKSHYIILASAKHVRKEVAQKRIKEIIDAIEHPRLNSKVDTSVRRTRELVAEEINIQDRVTEKKFMPFKAAVSTLHKLFKTDNAYTSISKATLNLALQVTSDMLGVHMQAQVRAAAHALLKTGGKPKSVKVKAKKAQVSKAKAAAKAKTRKKSGKKAGKRKGK